MNKFKLFNFTILISFLFHSLIIASVLKKESEKTIHEFFGKNSLVTFKKIIIPEEIKSEIEKSTKQRFFKDFVYSWKIAVKDSIVGHALLDNVYGKSMPITFLAIFDRNGHIQQAKIIKYREPIGGAVSNASWLRQFKGKNINSGFDVGSDIDSITGATISVYAVTKGLKKITILYNQLFAGN